MKILDWLSIDCGFTIFGYKLLKIQTTCACILTGRAFLNTIFKKNLVNARHQCNQKSSLLLSIVASTSNFGNRLDRVMPICSMKTLCSNTSRLFFWVHQPDTQDNKFKKKKSDNWPRQCTHESFLYYQKLSFLKKHQPSLYLPELKLSKPNRIRLCDGQNWTQKKL